MKNEQQLLMLYEYLLDRKDPRGLDVRFAKVLGMLPADERREMAETLPLPIKMLLQDSAPYKAAMIPQKNYFEKSQKIAIGKCHLEQKLSCQEVATCWK